MEAGKVREEFSCTNCGGRLTKRSIERVFVTFRDDSLKQTIRQAKQVPVLIHYTSGKQRLDKKPDEFVDRALLNAIERETPNAWFPTDRNTQREKNHDGTTTLASHMSTISTLAEISSPSPHFVQQDSRHGCRSMLLTPRATKLHRIAASRIGGEKKGEGGATVGVLSGTLYIPSNAVEMNILDQSVERITAAVRGLSASTQSFVTTGSATSLPLEPESVDYIFTDPPFGGNLMYSELNFLWEAWLRVARRTIDSRLSRTRYRRRLYSTTSSCHNQCFAEYHRVLKPGRWMTVEFHNSQNRVWAAIQEAIQHAGFVVSDVRTLDKKQGSFKQYNSANAVKQDLVISAYKPSRAFEEHFRLTAGSEAGAWEFVRSHLHQIPVFVTKSGRAEVIAERQSYLLFDRMVAFHVQRGYGVPLSASEFYAGLRQRFPERDGMFFLPEQVSEYDRKRLEVREVEQLELFVSDEKRRHPVGSSFT